MNGLKSALSALLLIAMAFMSAYGRNLSSRDASLLRDKLWNEYKSGLLQELQILSTPCPLEDAGTSLLKLPDTLEPNAVMFYRYGIKGDTIPVECLPLFIYLHGSGPSDREWATGKKLATSWDDSPSFYIIPKIPNEGKWYRWWQKSKQWAWDKFLRHALASDMINPDRIYFIGISEGGYGSQRLSSFYADYLAGAGPMAGGEPLANAPVENCRNIAFSLRTGNDDSGFYRNMLTGLTAAAFDSIASISDDRSFRHWIELIPDKGHFIDYAPTPAWLKDFTRNPKPSVVTWEDFEMDSLRRSGFYNIIVDEQPDNSLRTRYDLYISRDKNRIDINVRDVMYTTVETDSIWQIPLRFSRNYCPSAKGRFYIMLDDEMIDLDKKVSVYVNGRRRHNKKIRRSETAIKRSIDAFGDPRRLFTAELLIDLTE